MFAAMRVTFEEAFRLLQKWQYEETRVECWFEGEIAAHVFGHIARADGTIHIQSESCHLHIVVPQQAELDYGDYRSFHSSLRHEVAQSYEGLLCIRLSPKSSFVVGEMYSAVKRKENL
jgi:hypothetical protein